jgi:hypothetical protein
LLAKTAAYSIEVVTDRPLSLASQLLQGISVNMKSVNGTVPV